MNQRNREITLCEHSSARGRMAEYDSLHLRLDPRTLGPGELVEHSSSVIYFGNSSFPVCFEGSEPSGLLVRR